MRPPFGSLANVSIAGSIAPVLLTGIDTICTSRDGADASIARMKNFVCGEVSGLNITATRTMLGAISLSSSTHLPATENS
jgi:hypothetical protein